MKTYPKTPAQCGTDIDWKETLNRKNMILYFFPEIPFDNISIVGQEAYLFKNYFVRLDLKQNEIVGVTDDPRDLNKLFIQRFSIPFHLVYDRDHQIAQQFDAVWNGKELQRTLICLQKGGTVKGIYQGPNIEKKLKELVQLNLLPWYKKLFKKSF